MNRMAGLMPMLFLLTAGCSTPENDPVDDGRTWIDDFLGKEADCDSSLELAEQDDGSSKFLFEVLVLGKAECSADTCSSKSCKLGIRAEYSYEPEAGTLLEKTKSIGESDFAQPWGGGSDWFSFRITNEEACGQATCDRFCLLTAILVEKIPFGKDRLMAVAQFDSAGSTTAFRC